MAYCAYCGSRLAGTARFCPMCGSTVNTSQDSPATFAVAPGTTRRATPGYIPVSGGRQVLLAPQVPSPKAAKKAAKKQRKHAKIEARQAKYEIATTGERLVALIIDLIVIAILSGPVRFVFPPFPGRGVVSWLLGGVVALLYYFLFERFNKGTTIGKALMGLRSVREKNYKPVKPKAAFYNAFAKAYFLILDILLGVLTHDDGDQKHQIRLVQRATKTLVVKKRK